MSEYLGVIGTIVGALLAGTAMVANSYFTNRLQERSTDKKAKRDQLEKEYSSTQNFYEEVLHLSDKLIRNEGRASTDELEKFYKLEIRLTLISNSEVLESFKNLKSSISDYAHSLPQLPDEFIPKFEDDYLRKQRLEREKASKVKREKKAKKLQPDLYKKHKALSEVMKTHLDSIKNLDDEK